MSLVRNSRIALSVAVLLSWFWSPAALDPQTERFERVPVDYWGDIEVEVAWDSDHATAIARRMEASPWRFERRTQ